MLRALLEIKAKIPDFMSEDFADSELPARCWCSFEPSPFKTLSSTRVLCHRPHDAILQSSTRQGGASEDPRFTIFQAGSFSEASSSITSTHTSRSRSRTQSQASSKAPQVVQLVLRIRLRDLFTLRGVCEAASMLRRIACSLAEVVSSISAAETVDGCIKKLSSKIHEKLRGHLQLVMDNILENAYTSTAEYISRMIENEKQPYTANRYYMDTVTEVEKGIADARYASEGARCFCRYSSTF